MQWAVSDEEEGEGGFDFRLLGGSSSEISGHVPTYIGYCMCSGRYHHISSQKKSKMLSSRCM